jgi:Spy/CpxP family protein refolding chaperone
MKYRLIAGMLGAATLLVAAYAVAQAPGTPGAQSGPPGAGGPPPMSGPMVGGPRMHGPMMQGPMMRRRLSSMIDAALDRAAATPEQRVKVYAARDRVFAAMDAQRPDPGAHRDRMLALFEGDQLTVAQIGAVHQQAEQRRQTVQAAIAQAVVEVHDTLTPAQRKVVAEYVRTHGPGGPGATDWRGGPHGPDGRGGPGGMR